MHQFSLADLRQMMIDKLNEFETPLQRRIGADLIRKDLEAIAPATLKADEIAQIQGYVFDLNDLIGDDDDDSDSCLASIRDFLQSKLPPVAG